MVKETLENNHNFEWKRERKCSQKLETQIKPFSIEKQRIKTHK